jgi:hypothetical protein
VCCLEFTFLEQSAQWLINFKEFGFNLQRLLNPQCFNHSFPQRIWAWVDKKKK